MKTSLQKLLDIGIRHCVKISILGYIGGLVWLAVLAHPSMNNSTYFSENALLPGMVETNYNARYAKAVIQDVENPSEIYSKDFPAWVMDRMIAIGLEAYQQNFTVNLPEEFSKNGTIIGTNVYGILRAPRTAGTEAMVLAIPFKEEGTGPFYELALMMSLAEHFRNNVYWAKDIIFLVVDHKELGMQTWLDAYHGVRTQYVESSLMLGRSGAILGAIHFELDDKEITHIEVKVEGLNGQLPNLDLVNMVIRLCEIEHIAVSLKKQNVNYFDDGWDEYRSALSTMTTMMFMQATGHPSSSHGLFLKYGIEAVTLKGVREGAGTVGFGHLGRALEGMFRSLNNLLERFHQSFFFYLLPSTHRYISIGLYMPPLGCLMAGPILVAVACWVWSAGKDDTTESRKLEERKDKKKSGELNKDENQESTSSEKDAGGNEQCGDEKEEKESDKNEEQQEEEVAFTRIPRHFSKVLRVFLTGHFIGLLLYVTPFISRHIRPVPFDLEPFSFCVLALVTLFCISLVLPFLLSLSSGLTTRDVTLLKSLTLVVYICAVGCLATVNFSFGYFLAVFTVPSFLFVGSTHSRLRRLVQVFLVLMSSPPSILFLLALIYNYLSSQYPVDHEQLVTTATSLFTDSIFTSLHDSLLFSAWSFPVTTLILIPNWLLFWCIAWS